MSPDNTGTAPEQELVRLSSVSQEMDAYDVLPPRLRRALQVSDFKFSAYEMLPVYRYLRLRMPESMAEDALIRRMEEVSARNSYGLS